MRLVPLLAIGICLAASALAQENTPNLASPACLKRYDAIGLPRIRTDDPERQICRAGYALSFNRRTRSPDWVIERLPADFLTGRATRRDNFTEDTDLNAAVGDETASSTNADYSRQNYDRGHQAPAGDFKSSQPMTDQSFFLTNMSPQVGIGFNRGIWKNLEERVRGWILCGGRPELYVMTGPVYGDSARWIPNGRERVLVPEAYYKVVYDPRHDRAIGLLLPNRKLRAKDLPDYVVPITDIEEKTGINFFPALTTRHQRLLETNASPLWNFRSSCGADTDE